MKCQNCGAEIPAEQLEESWPPEKKEGLSDWVVTDTDILKMLIEAEKAIKYMEVG